MSFIRRSLANKLSFFISILLLIVFSFIGIISFKFISSKIEEKIIEKAYVQSESISKDVINIFEDAKSCTEQMALNRDIGQYLKEVKNHEDIKKNFYYWYVYDYLIKVKESNPIHFLAWVANERANFYLDSTNTIPEEDYVVSNRPWFEIAVSSNTVEFTNPYVEWNTKKIVISSIKALRENEEIYGFVVVDIMLDSIPTIFEKFNSNLKDKNFLITADGQYIYHEDESKIMKSNIYDKSDELNKYLGAIDSVNNSFLNVEYLGREYYLTSYTIDGQGWKVITLIDKGEIKEEIYRIYFFIIGFMIIAFLIALISINFIVRRYTNPYKMLGSFADGIAHGDFSKNIPLEFMDRTDEMGDICISFQKIINVFRNENFILEEKINEKNEELKEQYEYILQTEKLASLGNIVAGVAHEINTPLGIGVSIASHIKTINSDNLQRLENGTMTKENLKDFMVSISQSSDLLSDNLYKAAELIKNFKKMAVDQGSENKEYFNLEENIQSVIISLRSEYKKQNHKIKLNFHEDIEINSYPGRFSQIFTNLILNSIEHGFKDRTDGNIEVEFQIKKQYLEIVYVDDGIGISEENISKIYEPFFTTNRANGNSGLGMNVVFNIITQKLKGSINVSSEINKFTKFEIKIPLE